MNPRNPLHQASATRHLLNGGDMTDELRACVEGCIKTAEWVGSGHAALKEFIRMQKEEPELFKALCELVGMGTKLEAIRRAA